MKHRRRILVAAMATALGSWGCDKEEPTNSGTPPPAAPESAAEAPEDAKEPASDLPAAETILAKAVEAVGGRDKLEAIDSFYYKGQVSVSGQNMGGPIEIWWKDGDFFTTQKMMGVGQIKAGKRGETIWSQDPINGLRKLEGPEGEQHLWASSLMLAADWKDHFSEAETVAEREVDGTTVYDVKLTSDSGATLIMSFDADSGLQVAQSFEQVTPMGKMPISVEMEDYRTVEGHGIKIAFRQVTDAKLMKATQEISEIEVNAEVDPSKFAMPTGGAEVVEAEDMGKGSKPETMMPFDEDGKPGKPVPKDE
jgi:hypothetical protein